jgi:hypothetical protein
LNPLTVWTWRGEQKANLFLNMANKGMRSAFKSYSGDAEAFNVCVELALAMPPNTGTTVKLECGSESLTLPFVVEGIAISWSDSFVMMPLRESYLEDGGLGTIADIRGCSPSCRAPALEDTREMEIFVGLNPGFST